MECDHRHVGVPVFCIGVARMAGRGGLDLELHRILTYWRTGDAVQPPRATHNAAFRCHSILAAHPATGQKGAQGCTRGLFAN
jgi:hypothetical protein